MANEADDGRSPTPSISSTNAQPDEPTILDQSMSPPDTSSLSEPAATFDSSSSSNHTDAVPPLVSSPRSFGASTAALSDWINDHLILARCGAFATVGLLTVYGLAASPLFTVPYRSVSAIPRRAFSQRQRMVGRIVGVEKGGLLQFRPLAPWERYLPLAWTTAVRKMHPLPRRPTITLPLYVWGITLVDDPHRFNATSQQPRVVCHLLARGRRTPPQRGSESKRNPLLPDYEKYLEQDDTNETDDQSSMVLCGTVSLHHRWGADMGEHWVRNGRATVATDPGRRVPPGYTLVQDDDTSAATRTQEQQRLLRYVSQRLVAAEYEACAKQRGVWADPVYREARPDVVDEADFQSKATWWQRMWRWIRDRAVR